MRDLLQGTDTALSGITEENYENAADQVHKSTWFIPMRQIKSKFTLIFAVFECVWRFGSL